MQEQHKDLGRRLRVRERRRYTEEYADEEELLFGGGRAFDVEDKLNSELFSPEKFNFLREMSGEELNVAFIQQNGFEKPIIIKQMKGLGMKIPDHTFNVSKVKECVGSRRQLDVMDVQTQRDFTMSMKEWCNYYENPDRKRLLNVISLEFSHTKLEQLVDSPNIVKQVDWIDWVWPKHLKQSQTEGTNSIDGMKYPKVQKYCLMSVKNCYTDFHIDFGGTSVWYHILKGKKVFWLIPPTERNIQLYEQWVLSGKQSDIFFGDTVEQCARISLEAGNTFFIPTGWIHAVFTPEDSLVFGGNFLHSFSIEKQLRVAQVEDVTKVPAKFRYPFYTEVLWYVLARYVFCLMNKNHLKCNEEGVTIVRDDSNSEIKPLLSPSAPTFKSNVNLTPFELSGLKAIIMWLQRLPPNKRSLPDLIVSAEALLNDAQILIDEHSTDIHQKAITGRPVLFWSKKPMSGPSLTSQLRQIKPPSFALKQQMKAKETATTLPMRPESPPTRPISSNQYTISSGSTINQDLIPSSFAGLIAQTGVNHFQPFSPMMSSIGSPPTALPPMSVGYMTSSLPPPPPLISTTNPNISHTINSYQTTNSTQTTYTSFPQKDHSSEQSVNNQFTHNSNFYDKKPINELNNNNINNNNNNFGPNFTTTATQSQQTFSNYFVNSSLKRSSSPLTVNEIQTQTMRPFPTALPPSGFHSTPIQSEPFINKMVNSSTQSSFPINQKMSVSTGAVTNAKTNSNDSSRRRRTRCKKCDSCLRADCGECHFCKDMKKFGGPGRMKQSCIARQCLAPVLPHTACCMICGRDGWEKLVDPSINDETASSLMECSQCWEIVHPFCLNERFPQFSSSEANINEDLPNSWECPRCVKTGSKNNKYQKLKSTLFTTINGSTVKKDDNELNNVESEPPEKKLRLSSEDSPPTSDDEEDNNQRNHKISDNNICNNSNNSFDNLNKELEDTDNSSGSSQTEGNGSPSFLSRPFSLMTSHNSASAHVRSCARFPLLTQGLKQMANPLSNTFSNKNPLISNNKNNLMTNNGNNNTNNKSEFKGLAALMNTQKKKNETSRDRLFKSLKGLKKSSEMSVRFGSNCSQSRKSNKSNVCQTTVTTSTSSTGTQSSISSSNSCSSSNSSSTSSSSSNQSGHSFSSPNSISSSTSTNNFCLKNNNKIELNSNQIKNELHDESTDEEEVNEDVVQSVNNKQNGSAFNQIVDQIQREIVRPKYVVRPAPLNCDISESEESEESDEDCDEDSNDTNNNSVRKERMKAKQKYLRKFRNKLSDNLVLERDVVVPVMEHLSKKDLLNCMLICKQWNAFSMEPKLWRNLDLNQKKINSNVLVGIVRRQPRCLDLSWTNINKKQLFWLICRLPQLETLFLKGCPASVVSVLATCNCPRLSVLDISWSDSSDDDLMQDLLSAPTDSRPGFMETKTRLRFLSKLKVCGTNISDKTIRLITQNLPFVQRLDFSNCNKITDLGIGVLATAKAKDLTHLTLSACSNISDMSFVHLKKCPNILHLDLRECPQVTRNACHQFMSQYPPQTKLICN